MSYGYDNAFRESIERRLKILEMKKEGIAETLVLYSGDDFSTDASEKKFKFIATRESDATVRYSCKNENYTTNCTLLLNGVTVDKFYLTVGENEKTFEMPLSKGVNVITVSRESLLSTVKNDKLSISGYVEAIPDGSKLSVLRGESGDYITVYGGVKGRYETYYVDGELKTLCAYGNNVISASVSGSAAEGDSVYVGRVDTDGNFYVDKLSTATKSVTDVFFIDDGVKAVCGTKGSADGNFYCVVNGEVFLYGIYADGSFEKVSTGVDGVKAVNASPNVEGVFLVTCYDGFTSLCVDE